VDIPFNVSQSSSDLSLLQILLGQLLLLLSLECHVPVVFGAGVDGGWSGRSDGTADSRASDATTRSRVLEAVGRDGHVALVDHTSSLDVPLLRAEGTNELFVVGNHNDTTLVVTDSDGETTEGVTVQEVGRFVKDEKMGVVPHGTGKDDLDLLTTRETGDLVVVGDFRVQTQILKVLGDDLGGELTETETLAGSLVIIELLDELGEAERDQSLTRDLRVVLWKETNPFDLVLERLLPLLTTHDGLDAAWTTAILHVNWLLHLGLVCLGENTGLLHVDLTIITVGVTPLKVLVGGLLQMHLNVLKSVLLDVTDTQVGVLLDTTSGWDGFTSQHLDQSGLSSSVATNDGGTGGQRKLARDASEGWLGSSWVGVGAVSHTQNGAGVGLDTGEDTRRWELELDKGGREGVVTLGLWLLLDKLGQVTLVGLELLSRLVVVDVGADLVQESRVVRNDQTGDLGVGLEVLLQPFDVGDIQVVSRLVKEKDISLQQHGAGQSQLHLPSTGQGTDLLGLTTLWTSSEADFGQDLGDTLTTCGSDGRILGNKLEDADISVLTLVVLDEAGLEHILGWETLKLAVGNGAHKGGLSGTVATTETVSVSLEEAEVGVGEKKHTTVCKGEISVDNLNLAVILLDRLSKLALVLLEVELLNSVTNDLSGIGLLHEVLKVRGNASGNAENLAVVDILSNHSTNVWTGELESVKITTEATGLLDLGLQNLGHIVDGSAGNSTAGNVVIIITHGLVDDVNGTGSQLSDLWQRGAVDHTLNTGLELWQEGTGLNRIVDKLGQVLNNDNGLSDDFLRGGWSVEGTLEQWSEERKDGRGDDGDKGGLGEGMNGLLEGLGGRVLHGVDQEGDSWGNIVVGEKGSQGGHGLESLLLNLGLEIVHTGLDEGDQTGKLGSHGLAEDILVICLLLGAADLHLGLVGHLLEQLQSTDGALPLAALVQVLNEHGEKADDQSLGGQEREERIEGVLCGLTNGAALIGERIEGTANQAAILEEEEDLGDLLLWRKSLKESTDQVLCALALRNALLVARSLLGLGENAIFLQAAEADRVQQDVHERISSIDGSGRGGGREDGVEGARDLFLGWSHRGGLGRLCDHSLRNWCIDLVGHIVERFLRSRFIAGKKTTFLLRYYVAE
jgi:hypothetical protein